MPIPLPAHPQHFGGWRGRHEQVYDAIMQELKREQNKIELIASENFVSNSVMEAMRKLYDE